MEKRKKLTKKILKDRDRIKFIPIDKDYGRAEFTICPIWKNGKIQEVYIYHTQQKNIKNYYYLKIGYSDSLQIFSWTHQGIEKPQIWQMYWCKEHKTISYRIYVPNNSNTLYIEILSTLCLIFEKMNQ